MFIYLFSANSHINKSKVHANQKNHTKSPYDKDNSGFNKSRKPFLAPYENLYNLARTG